MSLTIVADPEVCIGSGMCVTYAPRTFDQDANAKVVVLEPPSDELEVVQAAIDACPTGAITLRPSQQEAPHEARR